LRATPARLSLNELALRPISILADIAPRRRRAAMIGVRGTF
jgi:hypothetical protein